MSRFCTECGNMTENIMLKFCKKCFFELKNQSGGLSLNTVSEIKRKRLKAFGSEKELFQKIWNKRPHKCECCGRELREARAHNFDHIKPKGMNADLRYTEENIQIVCFACHFKKQTLLEYKGVDLDL